MGTNQANTWPPLIGQNSLDGLGHKQLYGTEVTSSGLITAQNSDPFFFPAENLHTGYAWDGVYYLKGVVSPGALKASWYREAPGPYRGATPYFPKKGLILATDAGVSIIDIKDGAYTLWMLFLRGDNFGFTHNYTGGVQGIDPILIAYQAGRVVLNMKADAGAVNQTPAFLVFDLVLDQIYMERAATV